MTDMTRIASDELAETVAVYSANIDMFEGYSILNNTVTFYHEITSYMTNDTLVFSDDNHAEFFFDCIKKETQKLNEWYSQMTEYRHRDEDAEWQIKSDTQYLDYELMYA